MVRDTCRFNCLRISKRSCLLQACSNALFFLRLPYCSCAIFPYLLQLQPGPRANNFIKEIPITFKEHDVRSLSTRELLPFFGIMTSIAVRQLWRINSNFKDIYQSPVAKAVGNVLGSDRNVSPTFQLTQIRGNVSSSGVLHLPLLLSLIPVQNY